MQTGTECSPFVIAILVHRVNCMLSSFSLSSNTLHTISMSHILHEWHRELPRHDRPHIQYGHTHDHMQCTSRLKAE
jgi:hypothetical protein